MDRVIVWPSAIPQDLDLLNTNKNMMVGLGAALQAILGTSTVVDGFGCVPTTPASMNVTVGAGSIYSFQAIDQTAYGSIDADTTDQTVKQGIYFGNTTFGCPAPLAAGNSLVYLIQAQYQEVDGGATVLPYYNASNPSVPYSGPANAGTPNVTVRQGKCVLAIKAGTAATTGTQVAPAADAGYVGLWTVTVSYGATTVTGANIQSVTGAPFIGTKLTGKLNAASNLADVASPATALANLGALAKANNLSDLASLTTALTNLGGLARASNLSDVANAVTALANLGGAPLNTTVKTVKIQVLNANGTYTPNPGLIGGLYFLFGGGGGGGGCSTSTSTTGTVGAGGGGGGLAFGVLTKAQIGASQTLTLGSAGAAGAVNGAGGAGGTSALGSLMTATGGAGGSFIAATTGNGIPGGIGGAGSGVSGILSTSGPAGGSAFTIYGGSGGFFSLSGKGADTLFGTGGSAVTAGSPSSASGLNGTGFGAGGSGGASTGGASGAGGGYGSLGGFVAIEFCTQ